MACSSNYHAHYHVFILLEEFRWQNNFTGLSPTTLLRALPGISPDLFGGPSSSTHLSELSRFGHPHFSSQSWRTQKEREASGINTVTSARHCHHHCLKAHPRAWQCLHVQHQTLQLLSTWCCASSGAPIAVTEIMIASILVHGNGPRHWSLSVCIITLLKRSFTYFWPVPSGTLANNPKHHWILSTVQEPFPVRNLNATPLLWKMRV